MSTAERELDVLETIQRSTSPVRQRDIAHAIGLSLGMTNEILKRVAKKGWLSIRKVNSRNIQYVVSPKGMEEVAGRSYRYFKRTIGNIVRYKEAIERIVLEAKERGCTEVVLVGESDLEFIVEHACSQAGVVFTQRAADPGTESADPGVLRVYPESALASAPIEQASGAVSLRELLTRIDPDIARRFPGVPGTSPRSQTSARSSV
jgi:DNA-binding MarR family transcriptional regulator